MSEEDPEFREDLQWNSYFVDGLYDSIETEVQLAADQHEEEYGTDVPGEEIDQIVETIIDNGITGLKEENDSE